MTPWQRINKELLRKQKNWQWLANGLSMEIQRVHNWKARGVPAMHYRNIAFLLGVTVDWIEGIEPTHAAAPLAAYHVNTEALHNVGKVPLIDWVAAGTWHDISDPYPAGMAEDWLYCPSRHGSKAYALRVRGESMHNPSSDQSFKDGDIIFVDPDKVAINKSLVICRLDDSKQTTFKRLLIDGDSKMLEALNPSWPERIIRVNGNATICGVIIGKYEVY